MASDIIATVIIIVLLFSIVLSCVEFLVPFVAKWEMNTHCRNALLQIETEGILSAQSKSDLYNNLLKVGLKNISINSTIAVKQGQYVTLDVQADYIYSKLSALLFRRDEVQPMAYTKTTVSRKVVN